MSENKPKWGPGAGIRTDDTMERPLWAPLPKNLKTQLTVIAGVPVRVIVDPKTGAVIDANVRWLQANPDAVVIIEGHCDERGTEAYNLALGERRARAVRDYLLARGIAAARITIVSYGEERPSCTEHSEECWRENRRAAFVIKAKE